MSKQTVDNLKAAYAGESMARNYYTFFASVARKEGWLEIAEVFEETARNEKEHAETILKLLGDIKGSKENLLASIDKESYEWKDMYPEFERVAREEGEHDAATFFATVQQVEHHHADRFKKLLELLESKKLLQKDEKITWKCRECGYAHEGNEPPLKCPLCGHAKEYYEPVEKEYY